MEMRNDKEFLNDMFCLTYSYMFTKNYLLEFLLDILNAIKLD